MKSKSLLLSGTIEKSLGRFIAKDDKGMEISHGKTFVMCKKQLFIWAFRKIKDKAFEIKYRKTANKWSYYVYRKGVHRERERTKTNS